MTGDSDNNGRGNDRQNKRARVSRACENCRTKKIKCDGEKPRCSNCETNDIECVYTESIRKIRAKKSGSAAGLDELEGRLGRLESLLDSINSRLGSNGNLGSGSDSGSISPIPSHGNEHVGTPPLQTASVPGSDNQPIEDTTTSAKRNQRGWELVSDTQGTEGSSSERSQGNPNSAFSESEYTTSAKDVSHAPNKDTTDLYSIGQASNYPSNGVLSNACVKWISNATSDETLPERLGQVINEINENNLTRVQAYLLQQTTTPDLPSPELMEYAWKLLNSITGVWDYVISLKELRTVIQAASGEGTSRNGYADWLLLFSACTSALFIGSKYSFQTGEGGRKWSDEELRKSKASCCSGAIYYLNRSFLTPPTVTTLRGLVLLLVGLGCINFYPNNALASLSSRMALELGLHREETYQDKSLNEADDLRRLFWVLYSIDRETAMLNSRIPAIMDFDVSTDYPAMLECHKEAGIDADTKNAQLMRIYGEVYELLYSARASKSSPIEIVKHVSRLDKDLKAWRDSLEAKFRPGGDFTHRSSANLDAIPPRSWYTYWDVLHLHLGYFHLLSLIHEVTAFHPEYVKEAMDGQQDPRKYSQLYASLDICVSSARSTVKTLQMTAKFDSRLLGPSLLYCANAFTTLFLQCLARPRELSTLHDLEQMSALLDLFEIDADANSMYQARDDPGRRAVIKFWTILYQAAETHVSKHQSINPTTAPQSISPIPSTYQPSSPNLPFDDFFQFTDSTTAQSLYQLPSHLYSWDSEIANLIGNI